MIDFPFATMLLKTFTLILPTIIWVLGGTGTPYCLAGQPCFPDKKDLDWFNGTVGGKLIKAEAYGAVCYRETWDERACEEVVERMGDGKWRRELPAGLMYTNWEQDGEAGCTVPNPPKLGGDAIVPVNGSCTLGGMSAYVVNATSADDIVQAVRFAAKYNLRFRIKNSGHDYTGRSAGSGAFSIWTRYMNDAKLVKDFKPCYSSSAHDVVSAGPGVDVEELYAWGAANGKVTIGGFTPTVGATGGYILGGGTGPLGPIFGLGVDNIVQLEVVTANGRKVTANECTNPDLFWAMRGGGGAFAVTTRVYLKAYPAFTNVDVSNYSTQCKDYESYGILVRNMLDIQVALREANYTSIWESSGEQLGLTVLAMRPFTSEPPADRTDASTILARLKTENPNCAGIGTNPRFKGIKSWYDAYVNVIVPTIQPGSLVGVNLADFSRLISYDMIKDEGKMKDVLKFILNLPHTVPFIWQNAVGEATRKVAPDETSVHPGWRNAFAFMDVPVFGPWTGVTKIQNATAQAVLDNATAIFGDTTYYNEDYVLEKNWQKSMFGDNYKRLLEIKKLVDPYGVFNCRQCVGSEGGY